MSDGTRHNRFFPEWSSLSVGLLLLLVLLAAAWIRVGLLDLPLERDEGEYAYAGQLLLQGIPPYQQLYNMKLPGIYAVYAGVLAICGQTHRGIHWGLLGVNSATALALFFLTRRLLSPLAGVVAAASFSLLALGAEVQGSSANAEHFVILPVVVGLTLLLRGIEEKKLGALFASGLLLGVGYTIKQHGIILAAGAGFFLAYETLRQRLRGGPLAWRPLAVFSLGGLLPYLLICLWLLGAGVFAKFWFWTVAYARAYTAQVSWPEAWQVLRQQSVQIWAASSWLWGLVGLGLLSGWWVAGGVRQRVFLYGLVGCSFLAICPGFYFRPHYFILLLPAAAVLAGAGSEALATLVAKYLERRGQWLTGLGVAGLCLCLSLYQQRHFLWQMTPYQASSLMYWPNPFPESLEIARYLREHSAATDKIAIIGSEPQIFFYSGRQSATGYIYMYPLMEHHPFAERMQRELIAEVEAARPAFLVFVRIPYSWLQRPDSVGLIFDWLQNYKNNYRRVGLVEIFAKSSRSSWEPGVRWPPTSPYWLEIMQRVEAKGQE